MSDPETLLPANPAVAQDDYYNYSDYYGADYNGTDYGGGTSTDDLYNYDFDSLLDELSGVESESSWSVSKIVIFTLYGIVITFGVCGNLLVIMAVVGNGKMRTPRNFFICNVYNTSR